MAVHAMSRAKESATRGLQRTQPRGTSMRHHAAVDRGQQSTVGAHPWQKGGLAWHHLGGQWGQLNKPNGRRTDNAAATVDVSPNPRPRSEWLAGSHPNSPWSCLPYLERGGTPCPQPPAHPTEGHWRTATDSGALMGPVLRGGNF